MNLITQFEVSLYDSFLFVYLFWIQLRCYQCDQKRNRQMSIKSCPKMISVEKLKILTPLQKLPKNVGDLGKIIAAKGFKNLPKVQ